MAFAFFNQTVVLGYHVNQEVQNAVMDETELWEENLVTSITC